MNALTYSVFILAMPLKYAMFCQNGTYIFFLHSFAYSSNHCTWVTQKFQINTYAWKWSMRLLAQQVKMISMFKETTPSPMLEQVYSRKDNIYNFSFATSYMHVKP